MTGLDVLDDTTGSHERLETELVAQDRDAARVAAAGIDERSACHLVSDLIKDDVVTPVAKQRVFIHNPSSEAFDSITQFAVFHRVWRAATDVDTEGD